MYIQQEEKGNELERVHPFAHKLYGSKSHHHSSIRIILFSLGINQPPLCLTSGLGPRSPLQNSMGWHIYYCNALALNVQLAQKKLEQIWKLDICRCQKMWFICNWKTPTHLLQSEWNIHAASRLIAELPLRNARLQFWQKAPPVPLLIFDLSLKRIPFNFYRLPLGKKPVRERQAHFCFLFLG